MLNVLKIIALTIFLNGCFSLGDKEENTSTELGQKNINYYADKTVSSLEIPPDLTKPSSENALKLSEYVNDIEEDVISFSDKDKNLGKTNIMVKSANIEVIKSGNRKWLVVNKKPEVVWGLSKSFLKSNNFNIKKINKKIGLMETDFLENKADIPGQSLGVIRSMFKKAFKARYALPTVDKYRIRIEPIKNGNSSEVYLSLSSMEEVVTNQGSDSENTIWQSKVKDQTLEDEMLYRLMVYLGSDSTVAREKILTTKKQQKINVELLKGIGGYAKLQFSLNKDETWESVGWALDELKIDIEDKDVKENSYYVYIAKESEKGIWSKLFGDDAIRQSFRILVKQIAPNTTEVYFNDLSEKNEQSSIDFSYDFLGRIAKLF